jgi:hypothetical protein
MKVWQTGSVAIEGEGLFKVGALAIAETATGLLSVGVMDNDAAGTPIWTDFHGVAVDATSVLVTLTYVGDTNLDGVVDVFNDYPAFLGGYYGGGSTWAAGDFNYDGVIDVFNDYPAFLAGYYGQTGPLVAGGVEGLGGEGAVPEPATLGLLALGLAMMRRRGKWGKKFQV